MQAMHADHLTDRKTYKKVCLHEDHEVHEEGIFYQSFMDLHVFFMGFMFLLPLEDVEEPKA